MLRFLDPESTQQMNECLRLFADVFGNQLKAGYLHGSSVCDFDLFVVIAGPSQTGQKEKLIQS